MLYVTAVTRLGAGIGAVVKPSSRDQKSPTPSSLIQPSLAAGRLVYTVQHLLPTNGEAWFFALLLILVTSMYAPPNLLVDRGLGKCIYSNIINDTNIK